MQILFTLLNDSLFKGFDLSCDRCWWNV